jgi:hypothetical protein
MKLSYSWFDLILGLFVIVLLIPLVMRIAESITEAFGPIQ